MCRSLVPFWDLKTALREAVISITIRLEVDQISGQVAAKLRLAPAEVVNACKWGTWRNLSLSRASIYISC